MSEKPQDLMSIELPIGPDEFLKRYIKKHTDRELIVTDKLIDTWAQNCIVFNNVINRKDEATKFVVSAPTGSAKTENLITYCSMLPSDVKVLISTNLTAEADRLAQAINKESGEENRAVSYHSKKSLTKKKAEEYQIVVVSHQYYKMNNRGTDSWETLGNGRDLIVIDEALDTIDEITVFQNDLVLTLNFLLIYFKDIKTSSMLYKNIKKFQKDVQEFSESLQGTQQYGDDKLIKIPTKEGIVEVAHPLQSYSGYIPIHVALSAEDDEKTDLLESLKIYNLLTTETDESKDSDFRKRIRNTLKYISALKNQFSYTTAFGGQYAIHKVIDNIPKQSLACLDATSDVNILYKLREEHKQDLLLVSSINGVRDYSNVKLHVLGTNTGKGNVSKSFVKACLKGVLFGEKTLIITQKTNQSTIEEVLTKIYGEYKVEVAYWNTITGLNKWQDFDTCVIIGLNHKPSYFVTNRLIANTTPEIAFSEEQSYLSEHIKESNLVAEIIQAINRIRIRQVDNDDGGCKEANIYLTLPIYNHEQYISMIQMHMSNINILRWEVKGIQQAEKTHLERIIDYLKKNIKEDECIKFTSIPKELSIEKSSWDTVKGRKQADKVKFIETLKKHGFKIEVRKEQGSRSLIDVKYVIRDR